MKLTEIARKTIEGYIVNKEFQLDEQVKSKYSQHQACFVTLTKDNNLRGCIGSLEAHQPLWKDVQSNSIHAAFNDIRFLPLSKEELKQIKIEVSVLSVPRKLEYKNPLDLLNKINSDMGLILTYDNSSATFLPQVWKDLPDKVQFLEHLSRKARLNKDAWKTAEFQHYTIDAEKE
ncbi:MAG: AmmeMemoRadiSam system protein A [Nanoarchaeota archaeon]|nr:AmmeMemoRadiSam system protein A [Nanoarchaeota archaeon]MBU1028102.1 AmmeMemoRadiSam system protein A [Nanoarchaeota archaeon]